MIISAVAGRVRLRVDESEMEKTTLLLDEAIKKYTQLFHVSSNIRTGSLLVTYPDGEMSLNDWQEIEKELKEQGISSKDRPVLKARRLLTQKLPFKIGMTRKNENYALLASYAVCLIGLFTGKSLHVWGGIGMTLLSLKHVYDRKRKF